jgi:hypothetical protein
VMDLRKPTLAASCAMAWSVCLISISGAGQVAEQTRESTLQQPATTEAGAESSAPVNDLKPLLADLSSATFAVRQQATETLKKADAATLNALSELIDTHPDPETVRRLIDILDYHYQNATLLSDTMRSAAEGIEKANVSERWFVAEAAQNVLKRNSRRRIELTVVELLKDGVPLSPVDPRKVGSGDMFEQFGGAASDHQLQIFVDGTFPDTPRTYDLLRRLRGLQAEVFLRQFNLAAVYLIDGHKLGPEQIGRLKSIFGDASVQERGAVCLGITPAPTFENRGIQIGSIKANSSASAAGLRENDIIVAMNKEPLAEFDDLILRLRKFRTGDTITLQMRTITREGQREIDKPVLLKAWYDEDQVRSAAEAIRKGQLPGGSDVERATEEEPLEIRP